MLAVRKLSTCRMKAVTFIIVILVSQFLSCAAETYVIAQTQEGPVKGIETPHPTRLNKRVSSFKGVRFATPPINDLRFEPPQPPPTIDGVWDATRFRDGCVQKCAVAGTPLEPVSCTKNVSEDCLFLNVFTPQLNESSQEPLPVLVFIHGGFYVWGSGGVPLYTGERWASEHNMVVVTINYRLNIFGALTTEDLNGNYGILDQRQALKWVKANIHNFGGDPTKVTVSGQSAGAGSVSIQYISPGSFEYFDQAAIFSAPLGVPLPTTSMSRMLATEVCKNLGCPASGAASVACLKNVSSADLFEQTMKVDYPKELKYNLIRTGLQWAPHVDGEVIPMQPMEAAATGKTSGKPLYIGTVANETRMFIRPFNHKENNLVTLELALISEFGFKNASELVSLYTKGVNLDNKSIDFSSFLTRAQTDYEFYCPSHKFAKLSSRVNGNKTFVYFFDHIGTFSPFVGKACAHAVCHASDLPYIFDSQYTIQQFSPNFPSMTPLEVRMSNNMEQWLEHFTRNGTVPGWTPYSPSSPLTLNISTATGPVPDPDLLNFRAEYCDVLDKMGYYNY